MHVDRILAVCVFPQLLFQRNSWVTHRAGLLVFCELSSAVTAMACHDAMLLAAAATCCCCHDLWRSCASCTSACASTTCAAVTPGAAAPGRPMQQQQRHQCCCQGANNLWHTAAAVTNMTGYFRGSTAACDNRGSRLQPRLAAAGITGKGAASAGTSGRAVSQKHSTVVQFSTVVVALFC
jgi:hypothetical protein